jgi:hypothetical protein
VVYLHVNRERDFWCSSGIMVFPTHGLCKAGGSGTDNITDLFRVYSNTFYSNKKA